MTAKTMVGGVTEIPALGGCYALMDTRELGEYLCVEFASELLYAQYSMQEGK